MKKISICIPVLNEEKNITIAYEEITNLFKTEIQNYQYEIVFTDNHSSDETENIIKKICEKDQFVKYLRFKNNVGYDKSIMEGYKISTGEAAVVIDCDLQDPVVIVKKFIEEWEKGYDLVYGIRIKRNENLGFASLYADYIKEETNIIYEDEYRNIYRRVFGSRVMQKILRKGSHIMICDDHEFCKNDNLNK